MMDDLTLVIPAKYEAESLPFVLNELKKFNFKIKVVLEKTDALTINAISNFNCEIYFQSKKGYGNALIEGINSVNTEYFVIFNADGSFLPSEIERMYKTIKNQDKDLVFGSRYIKKNSSEDDTIITLFGNYLFSFVGKFFFNLPLSDILYTFVMGKTNTIKKINLKNGDFRFCVELPIKAKKKHLKISEIPSFERSRYAGKKKVNAFKDGFLILKEMIYLFFYKIK